MMFALLMACEADVVELQGVLTDGHDGPPIGGATVSVLEVPTGEVLAETTARESGLYRVEAPAGAPVFLVVSGEGLVPASFSGVTGLVPRHRIADGEVFAVSEADHQAVLGLYAGCPGVGEGGSSYGEVRAIGVTFDGEQPTVNTAWARLEPAEGDAISACYLDEDGAAYDPDAVRTGAAGAFGIFGVGPGHHVLVVEYDIGVGQSESAEQDVWMPEDGVVPRFPAWVEFALPE